MVAVTKVKRVKVRCFFTLILLFSIIDLSKTSIRSGGVFCCEHLCTSGNILTTKGMCSRTSSRAKYLGAKRSYYLNSNSCFQLARIATSGDVSKNPGPTAERKRSREKSTRSGMQWLWQNSEKEPKWRAVLCSAVYWPIPLKVYWHE